MISINLSKRSGLEQIRNKRLYQTEKLAVIAHSWKDSREIKKTNLKKKHLLPHEAHNLGKVFIQKDRNKLMNFEIPPARNLLLSILQYTCALKYTFNSNEITHCHLELAYQFIFSCNNPDINHTPLLLPSTS